MPWRRGNRLTLLQEREASGRVAEVFEELKFALGIGYVPVPFQAFAAYPAFLDALIKAMRPLLATREFFDSAARLRAEAYTDVHNYFKVAAIGEGLSAAEAAAEMELFGFVESAMLLMLSVQSQAFEGPVGLDVAGHPAGLMAIMSSPDFVNSETTSPPVKRVLDEQRHLLELAYYSDEQRSLTHSPELLFAYWRVLKPLLNTAIHERMVFDIRESAWKCALEIPVQVNLEIAKLLEAGVGEEEIGIVGRMTELLARGAAIGLMNAMIGKIGMEGGNVSTPRVDEPEERVA
ncbi:hypothetical protein Acid345_2343 [Candidatus Koribacter versatilis Ellin345]|uniref:Uncharacterized protein n=1 Tax=Koribacter versatilis (strain Ellin345) TaxID=204669 RepID=Q1IP56_KORVE|nr:halocarboxylic acid dehydrogenase DehI family protein [Candidatus Koribacter versatilis]ABF41344.1 hypothetical protein Acid345_2343 [Candidatus Koribacter versatilis Ellin345]